MNDEVRQTNTAKRAVYYQKAEELYVVYGFTIEMICNLFEEKVTDRTLRNWRKDFDWDGKRRKYLDSTRSLLEDAMAMAKEALVIARAKPTQDNIKSFKLAVESVQKLRAMKADAIAEENEDNPEEKQLTPEKIDEFAIAAGLR